MCGIYGFNSNFDKSKKLEILKRMGNSLSHRGPDYSGSYIDDNLAMGIERLSVLDIKNGLQPVFSNNKRFVIVYNGEIYNHLELRKDLHKSGYIFKTNSDTELLVNLFQHKGIACLSDLNGMFAFAIYDIKKKEIFIARDRFGIKPLYYHKKGKTFSFASELKGLLCFSEIDKTISPESIDLFLTMEYVPAPYSIYKEIYKLEQGHYLIVSDAGIKKKKWYEFDYQPKTILKTKEEYIDEIDYLINKSVKMRTLSDVPFGSFLSGGLDSSLISYYLSSIQNKPIKTFNISFEDSSFDESNHANTIASYLGTDHTSEVFSRERMIDILPLIWEMMDEPFSDPSLLPSFLLSQLTKNDVTVALSGDGGDEVFAGYPTYLAHRLVKLIPKSSYQILAAISDKLPINNRNMSFDFKLRQFTKGLGVNSSVMHQFWLGSFNTIEKMNNYTSQFKNQLTKNENLEFIVKEHMKDVSTNIGWEKHLYQDFRFYLQDDMLVKVDRSSMANSLEVRIPFLDHNIVEYMAKVPSSFKYNFLTSKYLLKKLGEKYLPRDIVYRPKKGFGIPVADWLLTTLKKPMENIVNNPNSFINSIFNKKYTQNLFANHINKKQNNRKLLYTLFTLENWYNSQV